MESNYDNSSIVPVMSLHLYEEIRQGLDGNKADMIAKMCLSPTMTNVILLICVNL